MPINSKKSIFSTFQGQKLTLTLDQGHQWSYHFKGTINTCIRPRFEKSNVNSEWENAKKQQKCRFLQFQGHRVTLTFSQDHQGSYGYKGLMVGYFWLKFDNSTLKRLWEKANV